jgi:putative PIN family toxin of toxin-antitoxin system
MKVFLDTNVLVAAFISHGFCNELFDYCLSKHTICVSQFVIDELYDKLVKKFHFTETKVEQVVSFIIDNTLIIEHSTLSSRICRDPKDDNILAAAISGKVDCIVSGDNDLLVLNNFQNIPILKPADFWKFEKKQKY